jgi:hypothetical protein
MSRRGGPPGLLVSMTLLGLGAIAAFIVGAAIIGEDFAIPAMIAAAVVSAIALRGPVGKALAERIRGDELAAGGMDEEELHLLRSHMERMEDRVLELEERHDFTERLLARRSLDAEDMGRERG